MANRWIKILGIALANGIIWLYVIVVADFYRLTFFIPIAVWYSIASFCLLLSGYYLFFVFDKTLKPDQNPSLLSTVALNVPKIIAIIATALILTVISLIWLFGCSWTSCKVIKDYLPLSLIWFTFLSLSILFVSKKAFTNVYWPTIKWILIVAIPVSLIYMLYNIFVTAFSNT